MTLETIIATLTGVIITWAYIDWKYVILKKSGLKSVSVYNKDGELVRTIDKSNVAEYLRER